MSDMSVEERKAVFQREWGLAESLQALSDLRFLATNGFWGPSVPEWIRPLAAALSTHSGDVSVRVLAYQKASDALAKELLRKDPEASKKFYRLSK